MGGILDSKPYHFFYLRLQAKLIKSIAHQLAEIIDGPLAAQQQQITHVVTKEEYICALHVMSRKQFLML